MIKKNIIAITAIALGLLGVSCSSDDGPPTSTLTLETVGLEPLKGGATYQGWLIVNGQAKPTNRSVDARNVTLSALTSDIVNATEFILTIEPAGDNDAEPSNTRILRGDFGNSNVAQLGFEEVVTSFEDISGKFFMATPTDNDTENERSGIWFMDNSSTPPTAGLVLNPLKNGWKYEGWVVINNIPVSTGTFTSVSGPDEFNPFSSSVNTAPAFPGEDFLNNSVSPEGLTFPVDLRGASVVISVEPSPDNDPAPFFFKPLKGNISATDAAGDLLNLNPDSARPSGQVKRP